MKTLPFLLLLALAATDSSAGSRAKRILESAGDKVVEELLKPSEPGSEPQASPGAKAMPDFLQKIEYALPQYAAAGVDSIKLMVLWKSSRKIYVSEAKPEFDFKGLKFDVTQTFTSDDVSDNFVSHLLNPPKGLTKDEASAVEGYFNTVIGSPYELPFHSLRFHLSEKGTVKVSKGGRSATFTHPQSEGGYPIEKYVLSEDGATLKEHLSDGGKTSDLHKEYHFAWKGKDCLFLGYSGVDDMTVAWQTVKGVPVLRGLKRTMTINGDVASDEDIEITSAAVDIP